MHTRVCALFFVFAFCLGLFVMQMLSVLRKSETAAASERSHALRTVVGETRGMFYDRALQPLVNREGELCVAVKPSVSALAQAETVLAETENKDALYQTISDGKIGVAAAAAPMDTAQTKTVQKILRYGTEPIAVHLLGYVDGENNGVSGLEQVYNDELRRTGGVLYADCAVDAKGRLLDGVPLRFVRENYCSAAGFSLTLDAAIQRIAERALQDFSVEKGAVVVLSVETAEILAMASVPLYDPHRPADFLENTDGPFLNRAITPFCVGSVFKPVVAAAYLEAGGTEDTAFTCFGACTVGQTVFHCHRRDGHGAQNLFAAMANSCNPYFIHLADCIGAQAVCAAAENLGLGQKIELADNFYTKSGVLPLESELQSAADLANLSFGQGRLLASPLQMTALYAAIANNGVYRAPSLMRAKVDAAGEVYQRAALPAPRRALSAETAARVGTLLRYAVTHGAGTRAEPSACAAAGKTGTAQSGWIRDDGTEITHAWFCGYFPYADPQYAVTVLKEDGQGGSVDCAPIFRQIADEIWALRREPADDA